MGGAERHPSNPSNDPEYDPDDPIGNALRSGWKSLREDLAGATASERLIFRSNMLLVVIGFIAATVYALQLWVMHTQLNHTSRQLDLTQYQMRPWVIPDITYISLQACRKPESQIGRGDLEKPPKIPFGICSEALNRGQSPALDLHYEVHWCIDDPSPTGPSLDHCRELEAKFSPSPPNMEDRFIGISPPAGQPYTLRYFNESDISIYEDGFRHEKVLYMISQATYLFAGDNYRTRACYNYRPQVGFYICGDKNPAIFLEHCRKEDWRNCDPNDWEKETGLKASSLITQPN